MGAKISVNTEICQIIKLKVVHVQWLHSAQVNHGRYAHSFLINTPVCQSSDTLMCSKQYLCSCHRTFQWCANCLLYQAVNSLFIASQLDIWSWEERQAPWFRSWIQHIHLFSENSVCCWWTVSFSSCKWAGGFLVPVEQIQPGITGWVDRPLYEGGWKTRLSLPDKETLPHSSSFFFSFFLFEGRWLVYFPHF